MRPKTVLGTLVVLLLTGTIYAKPIKNAIPDVARPLPLSDVRVTGGPLKRAQDLNAEYLLKLEPDRMMAYYRKRAGLQPKAPGYPGWDGDGKNLTGHIAGHYLSGVSLMFAATGDLRFKARADYIVHEMSKVQDKNGDGYLGAIEGLREKFAEVGNGNIKSTFFDLNGLWSPWYTLHKTYAGLRDAYRFTNNRTALELEIKFAAWAESVLAKLTPEQMQQVLNTEFGGMNEVLADLYADTGDKRWLNLSRRFDHHAFLDPLKRREDKLAGQHGNTQVPKMLGVLMQYKRTWKTGDSVALVLPKTLRVEALPDDPRRAALIWGPLVLVGDLGPERRGGPGEPPPALVTGEKPVDEWLQPVPDRLGVFRTVNVGRDSASQPAEVEFTPFYRLHRRTYAVYWDLYTAETWAARIAELNAEKARREKLEAATIAFVQPGDPEKEKAFNQQGEETAPDRILGRAGRRAKKWFSFELPVHAANALALVVTYNPEERAKRTFTILVNGQRVGEGEIARFPPGSPTGKFYDVDYKIPAELVKDKQKVTVRFESSGGNETATVFGIRIIRADER